MSRAEWTWVPDYQLYYSAVRNLYAKPSGGDGQWEYLAPSRFESSSGGIGDVGWGLGVGPSQDTPIAERLETPAKASSQPQPIRVLRLVKLSSDVLPREHTVAILDDRPEGYLLGRDRVPHSPLIRLKEMEVSKTHARIFFWNERQEIGVDDGWELVTDENFRGEGFYVVDVGQSTRAFGGVIGTLIECSRIDARDLPKRTWQKGRDETVERSALLEAATASARVSHTHRDDTIRSAFARRLAVLSLRGRCRQVERDSDRCRLSISQRQLSCSIWGVRAGGSQDHNDGRRKTE